MKIEQKTSKLPFWKWFLMLLIPPYGIYYLLFRSRFKWYIKIPLGIALILILVLAIDQKMNPYRVENVQVDKSITVYLSKHSDEKMGTFRAADRKGAFVWNKKTQIVYRTLTSTGLYDFIMEPSKPGEFKVDGVFQTYPVVAWRSQEFKDRYPTAPMAMLYFYDHKKELGDLKSATEDDSVNTIKTTKGTFRYTFEKDKVVFVKKTDGEIVLQQKNEYDMPEDAKKYFKKHEKELGKLKEVYGYDMDSKKEMYYVKTSNGIYRVDDYRNGNIKLLQEHDE